MGYICVSMTVLHVRSKDMELATSEASAEMSVAICPSDWFMPANACPTRVCWLSRFDTRVVRDERDDDRLDYQGKSYDFIGFDEVTHFTYLMYDVYT